MPNRPNFPIPDDIYAEPFCLCIQVPNDPIWKQNVAGLLDELNQWYNWQRDDEKSGKDCARVWRGLYSQIDWTTMSCCCGDEIPVQYRFTGDGVMQRSTDGGVTWEDAREYDPRHNSTQFPHIPVEGDNGKCSAADSAVVLIREQVGDQLTDGMSRYTLDELLRDWVGTYIQTSNPFSAFITVITNQIFALVISALMAALNDGVYDALRCAFYCSLKSDYSYDDVAWGKLREKILADISGIAGIFLEHLIYLLGPVGCTNLARAGAGAADADCTECDCGTCPVMWEFINAEITSISDDGNVYTILTTGPGHLSWTSGDSSEGCYLDVPHLGSWNFWPLGSMSPVLNLDTHNNKQWNGDTGDTTPGLTYVFTFSKYPIP